MKLVAPIYNNDTSEFQGLKEMLDYIMLRSDQDEVFFSHEYSEEKSAGFFAVQNKEFLMHSSALHFINIYQKLSTNLTARNLQKYFSFHPVPLLGKRRPINV